MKIRKILISPDRKFYWSQGDLHSQDGTIKEKELKENKVKTNLGKEFHVLDANFLDNLERIKRGPAIIIKKDIGAILAHTDLNKDSIIIEAGTGSAHLTASISRYVKKIISYERNKQFFQLAKNNLDSLNITNIQLKNRDIYKGIQEKNVDAVILDLEEPWKALTPANKSLKSSGYLVAYLPNITQVKKIVNESKNSYYTERILENIEREWIIDEKRARPKNMIIGHTAWLVFLRKT